MTRPPINLQTHMRCQSRGSRVPFLMLLMVCVLFFSQPLAIRAQSNKNAGSANSSKTGRYAFVTMLYSDDFSRAVRVLGQSLRETGTSHDMIVVVTQHVSRSIANTLQKDGWIVRRKKALHNPFAHHRHFRHVITKLIIWTMDDYDRVAWLDADIAVLKNIDNVFECGTFCCNMRHSERFNTGFMVVTPSQATFNDMMEKLPTSESYTGGDQGYLSVYFRDLQYSPMYDDTKNATDQPPSRNGYRLLSSSYNSDIGVYYLVRGGSWLQDEVRVLHYTLGHVKPWHWYSSLFFYDLNDYWQSFESRLPTPSFSTYDHVQYMTLATLPLLCTAVLAYANVKMFPRDGTSSVESRPAKNVSRLLQRIGSALHNSKFRCVTRYASWYMGFPLVLFCGYFAYSVTPENSPPLWGRVVFTSWFLSSSFVVAWMTAQTCVAIVGPSIFIMDMKRSMLMSGLSRLRDEMARIGVLVLCLLTVGLSCTRLFAKFYPRCIFFSCVLLCIIACFHFGFRQLLIAQSHEVGTKEMTCENELPE